MKRSTLTITALVVLLVLSNAFWLYQIFHARIREALLMAERREALTQIFALIPVLAQKPNRARIIATAADGTLNKVAYEKDGYVWVGSLGLRFTDNGQLVEAVTMFPIWPRTPEERESGARPVRHSTGIMSRP